MPADTAQTAELPSEFDAALGNLQTLLSQGLWRAKFNSCGAAWSEIKRTKSAKRRIAVFDEQFQKWLESSAASIREWLPKFVALAEASSDLSQGNMLEWAKGRVWYVVEGQCGLRRAEPGDVPGLDDHRFDTMVYWCAVASEGRYNVNAPPLRRWKAPRWLAPDGDTDSLLMARSSDLWFRLDFVIDEALRLAQIPRIISSGDAALRRIQSRASTLPQPTPTSAVDDLATQGEVPFKHSDDYCQITYRGETYKLTAAAGQIVRVLHEAYKERKVGVGSAEIRKRCKCGKVWDQFRRRDGRRFWTALIRKNEKDFFELNLPPLC